MSRLFRSTLTALLLTTLAGNAPGEPESADAGLLVDGLLSAAASGASAVTQTGQPVGLPHRSDDELDDASAPPREPLPVSRDADPDAIAREIFEAAGRAPKVPRPGPGDGELPPPNPGPSRKRPTIRCGESARPREGTMASLLMAMAGSDTRLKFTAYDLLKDLQRRGAPVASCARKLIDTTGARWTKKVLAEIASLFGDEAQRNDPTRQGPLARLPFEGAPRRAPFLSRLRRWLRR